MRGVRGIALILALAVLAGLAGAWLGGRYLAPRPHEPSLHELVHHELDLTPEQERRIELLEERFATRRSALQGELRAANQELAAAIGKGHALTPQVQAGIEHFHDAMGRLQQETILHVLQMRAVLTPAQARVFDDRVQESLTEERP